MFYKTSLTHFGNQFFYDSRDQLHTTRSYLHKREEPGNEVVTKEFGVFKNLLLTTVEMATLKFQNGDYFLLNVI